MKYVFFCFTEDGKKICQKLRKYIFAQNHSDDCHDYEAAPLEPSCIFYTVPRLAEEPVFHAMKQPLSFYVGEWFSQADAIFFISACGIAVRSIAEFIKDKTSDPAVLVIDDTASYVIPLLSGHIGGANELAKKTADILKAVPVITTSTDRHQVFSVDSFAKKNGLFMRILSENINENQTWEHYPENAMKLAKRISSDILQKKKVYWNCDFYFEEKKTQKKQMEKETPNGLFPIFPEEEIPDNSICIHVTVKNQVLSNRKFSQTLLLIPRIVHIGIGCKKNIPDEFLINAFFSFLSLHSLCLESVSGIASIDLKKEESALLRLSEILQIPFSTFPAETLRNISGEFTTSSFVSSITGVDNVCERSAVCAAGNGRLMIKKTILKEFNGITFAAATENFYLKKI